MGIASDAADTERICGEVSDTLFNPIVSRYLRELAKIDNDLIEINGQLSRTSQDSADSNQSAVDISEVNKRLFLIIGFCLRLVTLTNH
jgi:hypothetical protein